MGGYGGLAVVARGKLDAVVEILPKNATGSADRLNSLRKKGEAG